MAHRSFSIDYLRGVAAAIVTSQPSAKVAILFAYCRYSDRLTAAAVLRGLVMQLLHQVPQALPSVKEFHKSCSLRRMKLSSSEATSILRGVAGQLSGMQIVVDGLDEVPEETERQELLQELRELPAQLLILSRPLEILRSELLAVSLSIEARNDDIVSFVESTIKRHLHLSRILERDPQLAKNITKTIREKSQGMYVLNHDRSTSSKPPACN